MCFPLKTLLLPDATPIGCCVTHATRVRGLATGPQWDQASLVQAVINATQFDQTFDPNKVALETGNLAAVIMEDYLELTTSEDAARWFKTSPSAKGMAALTVYANKLKRALAAE